MNRGDGTPGPGQGTFSGFPSEKFIRKKFRLGLESNPGPHASQSATLTTRPHGISW